MALALGGVASVMGASSVGRRRRWEAGSAGGRRRRRRRDGGPTTTAAGGDDSSPSSSETAQGWTGGQGWRGGSTSWLGGGVARALEAFLRRECDRPPGALCVALVGARNRSVIAGKLGTVRVRATGVEFRGVSISELDAEAVGVSVQAHGRILAAPFDLHAAVRITQADLARTLGLEDVSRAVLDALGRPWRPGDALTAQLLPGDRLRLSGWKASPRGPDAAPFPAALDARLAIGPSPSTLRLHALPAQADFASSRAHAPGDRPAGAPPPHADAYGYASPVPLAHTYVDFDLGRGTRLSSLHVHPDAISLTAIFTVTP